MKTLLTVSILACVALAGCGGTAAITPQQVASAIADGCLVVQPALAATSTVTANPAVAAATVVNGAFCTADDAAVASSVAKAAAPVAASAPAASQ
jgi:ABC-type Fe3+-hydroxamate transport system substrate-binding protein